MNLKIRVNKVIDMDTETKQQRVLSQVLQPQGPSLLAGKNY